MPHLKIRVAGKKKKKKKQYHCFLSHATTDKFIAVAMCRMLEEGGATTFRDDRDIAGGDDIPDKIREAIGRSAEVIVLLTPNSINRPWVSLEVGAAWFKNKARIVAVLYNVTTDPIPTMIRSKKAIQLNDFDDYVSELKKRIAAGGK